MGIGAALPASAFAQSGLLSGSVGGNSGSTSMRLPRSRSAAVVTGCLGPGDCDDNLPCTADHCIDGACLNLPVPGCVPCELSYDCPPVDLVFIMDTSGSMRDEAAVLCAQVFSVSDELAAMGINASINSLGITELPGGPFDCLSDTVVSVFGDIVPGELHSCPFPNGSAAYETWGPATAIVAQNYPWAPGATRIIVPMSDEGPCNGSRPEGCNDPGDDRESIDNAIAVALANHVIVSPIAGTSSDACVINLGTAIAKATGGHLHQLKSPKSEFQTSLIEIILQSCVADARCDDREVCTNNDNCVDGRCLGTPVEGCKVCLNDVDCEDQSLCTSDACIDGFCEWTPLPGENECCDPTTGSLTPISDNNPCTTDECNSETGSVVHQPGLPGYPCDDGLGCTINDSCDETGACRGVDINVTPCSSDPDCQGAGYCDLGTGYCSCSDAPTLCLKIASSTPAECYSGDEIVNVLVELGASPYPIVAGQFLIEYDPTQFDVLEIIPGRQADETSIFETELAREIDESVGRIFYAVAAPLGTPGTRQPATLALLRLLPRSDCGTTDPLCFLDDPQRRTFVVSEDAEMITVEPCCSAPLKFSSGPPELTCPQPIGKNADAGRASAQITWATPTAMSDCDGPLQLTCTGTNPLGMIIDSLALNGGRFPIGVSTFRCTTMDSCGATAECEWEVNVHDAHTVVVDIEISAPMTPLALVRCIELEFFTDCFHAPVVTSQPVMFGGLFNFPGLSKFALKIPAGQYGCVTARDPLHTLRSAAPLAVVNNQYAIRFRGDPKLGGNWLINGNLNSDRTVDILDHTLFLNQYQARLDRNSTCEGGTHADFNGDGVVDLNDLAFIDRALYETDKGACCPENVSAAEPSPLTEISLDDPDLMGSVDFAKFDFNHDGMLDRADIVEFLHHEVQTMKNHATRRSGSNDPR